MKSTQFLVTELDPMSKGVGVIRSKQSFRFAESREACTYDINPIRGFEIRVKADRNLVAFGQAHLPVDLLMVGYLGEVQVLAQDHIQSLIGVELLGDSWESMSGGAKFGSSAWWCS